MAIIAVLIICFAEAKAQWLTTGNPLSGGEVLGSTNSFPLVFQTNGTEAARFLTGGQLVFGSTSLVGTEMLSLQGTQNSNLGFLMKNSSTGTSAEASITLRNSSTYGGIFLPGTGYTPYGALAPNVTTIFSPNTSGIALMVDAAGPITFSAGTGTPATEIARFVSTGELGLGTTTPGSNFLIDAVRSVNAGVAGRITNVHTGNNAYCQWNATNASHYALFGIVGTGTNTINNEIQDGSYFETNGSAATFAITTNNPMSFWTNTARRMTITGGGDVGIGSSTPSGILDVESSSENIILNPIGTGTGSGRVGIGTTSPAEFVHIEKDQNAPTSVILFNTTSGTNASTRWALGDGIYTTGFFHWNSGSTAGTCANCGELEEKAPGGFSFMMSNSTVGADWRFYTNSGTQRMIIQQGGNVGIGTATPGALLDVAGNVNISSTNAYQINGSNVVWHNGNTQNIFVGQNAGNSTMTGSQNSLIGNNAGTSITSGNGNTVMGLDAFEYNTTGGGNTAIGFLALEGNNGGGITGTYNTALGAATLSGNTTGSFNSAAGISALADNTTGSYNTANGSGALGDNTVGAYNTAIGGNAGGAYNNNNYNTFVGYYADVNANNLSNMTAIGNGAIASSTYNFVCGNATVNGVFSTAGFSATSDGRFKTNIKENVKGLEFIKGLRPVTYNLDTKSLDDFIIQNMPDSVKAKHRMGMDFIASTAKVHSGFIAQEVEKVAQQVGYTSSIVTHPVNNNEPYALNYAELVVPLVKAVQEQQAMIDSLTSVTKALQNQINSCCSNSQQGMRIGSNNSNGTGSVVTGSDFNNIANSSSIPAATLYQNNPNPFGQQTNIQYIVPTTSQSASIMIFDLQGKLVKTAAVTNYGSGSVTINGNELSPGMFVYSLVVDGKIIDTKRMILTQ